MNLRRPWGPPPRPFRVGGLCIGLMVLTAACILPAILKAQERTGYLSGERQGLEILVHVMGEVQKPGEYRVGDQTDLLELLSKAGGPTPYSRLSSVSVRRTPARALSAAPGSAAPPVEILRVNIEDILRKPDAAPPPMLQPGDVVFVPKNSWHTWRNASSIIRDVSVVVSAYFLYVRATNN